MEQSSLSGHAIMVVEDDYFIATDAAGVLACAGAQVIGPCPTEDEARAELAKACPSAAILDINLGAGPSFGLAQALRDRGVPFVFTTGYDDDMIPEAFRDVERFEKPVEPRRIVNALAKALNVAP